MRILIVGAGAVGGYFGGRLAQAGRDVTFLVRPRRAEQIQAPGLRILSPYYGDFTVRPKTITAAQIVSPYDIIFLSVKSYALTTAIDDFAPAVGPGTVIIPVLNGMHHMDVLTERFGENSVLGGVCLVATEIDSQGRIVQLADFQSLTYGGLDGKKTTRIEAVHNSFAEPDLTLPFPETFCATCGRSGCGWPAWEPLRVCLTETSTKSWRSPVAPS